MMATAYSDGSPAAKRKASTSFAIHEDQENEDHPDSITECGVAKGTDKHTDNTSSGSRQPLEESTMGNSSQRRHGLLAVPYKKYDHTVNINDHENGHPHVEELLSKLAEQQQVIVKQQHALASESAVPVFRAQLSDNGTDISGADTSSSKSSTSAVLSQLARSVAGTTRSVAGTAPADPDIEVRRLKEQLIEAQSKIARMDEELTQTRIAKSTMDHVLGPASEAELNSNSHIAEQPLKNHFPSSTVGHGGHEEGWESSPPRVQLGHGGNWAMVEDTRSETSEALSAGAYQRSKGIWTTNIKSNQHLGLTSPIGQQYADPSYPFGQQASSGPWYGRSAPQSLHPLPQRVFPGLPVRAIRNDTGFPNAPSQYGPPQPVHRPGPLIQQPRIGNAFAQRNNPWGTYPGPVGPTDSTLPTPQLPPGYQSAGYPVPIPYQPRPIGTPLSPTATEFRSTNAPFNPWNTQAPANPAQTYVSTIEPLNYRRLLERSVNCNWKYIVDKIVCNNDQQASIFLQQKLKVGTVEQKFEIVEAIVAQAYPLMVNRFGNFLVQRCFEHGTPEQVIGIANAIRGNTLNLSMDAFGCHVIQKAFDSVPEEYKAVMVHELLRRIPETVVHRYACHVWQKLFELRWSDSPPQIMKYVNEALLGMWHEVALGETGSLVVQNIFENCLEEDKRPCINEVLASIDLIAHGQFGNWCIQHVCEHGLPADRSRAIDHVIRNAAEYSMDQFASKVVEKCLKVGGPEFLERYLDRVCEGRPDRPRIPLIDIASDQYGNYLIQYILTHSNPQHREIVACHIRKHMVSLRGSKFGSRVGMLCCNPAFATRPGPGVGPPVNRFTNQATRYGNNFR